MSNLNRIMKAIAAVNLLRQSIELCFRHLVIFEFHLIVAAELSQEWGQNYLIDCRRYIAIFDVIVYYVKESSSFLLIFGIYFSSGFIVFRVYF